MDGVKRILYKISGESLGGYEGLYSKVELLRICGDISKLHSIGVSVCIVVGGGNVLRGRSVKDFGIDRISGDYMGMLATVMNAISVQSVLESEFKKKTTVMSSLRIDKACSYYNTREALSKLSNNEILIFAAGIGSPYFSTDTGAAIRSAEMGCDLFIKGTTVDGVYSSDPKQSLDAVFYEHITYKEVISRDLMFMDRGASMMLMESDISSIVFSIKVNKNPLNDLFFKGVKHTLITN
ncbi:MAG: UMP kinase [Alphaproteobacteria bacterium]|nr:UMP kinase [Rickettsiales bacterium]